MIEIDAELVNRLLFRYDNEAKFGVKEFRNALQAALITKETNDLTQAMLEYAQAIRGDWSEFDGRSERDVIESWVDEINAPSGRSLEEWRDLLDLCPDGNGHWAGFKWGHCDQDECPASYRRWISR